MSRSLKDFLGYYNTFFEKVYRYIFFRVGRNKELAEDLTSEIFMKAMESFDSFDESRPFSVWIYRVAHNHLADHYKKFKPTIVAVEDAENILKSDTNILKTLDDKLGLEKVQTALETLPENQKQVVLLKYFSEFTNTEVADILNTTEAHIRVLQYRAMQSLRLKLSFLAA